MNLYLILALVIIYLVPYILLFIENDKFRRRIYDLELCRDQFWSDMKFTEKMAEKDFGSLHDRITLLERKFHHVNNS